MSDIGLKLKLRPAAQTPLVADGEVNFTDVAAVIFRNAGDATVNIWNGMYTLDSKETVSLNVTELNATMDLINIPVTFDTSTGTVKKLQIILLKASYC